MELQCRHNDRDGFQITGVSIVYSTVCSDADKKKTSKLHVTGLCERNSPRWLMKSPHKGPVTRKIFPFDDVIMDSCLLHIISMKANEFCCPACRTTLVATRFRVAVICPIIQVPHCIRVFFYFVWFVFINHIFQFYYELCTYCNILDIYLS